MLLANVFVRLPVLSCALIQGLYTLIIYVIE